MVMEEVTPDESSTAYAVDVSWFEENRFSFDDFVQSRMCDSCQSRLDEEVEERFTVLDQKSGRASFEIRRTRYGSNPVRVIHDCCSKKRHYITPDMPTLEAVFRVFLANSNQPLTLGQVREQLAEWCPGGGCQWLLLPVEQLERLVQHDRYYGIRASALDVAA
ncbi:MAG: hypothetical protein AB7P40_12680 [Chloroflexota bacterium]